MDRIAKLSPNAVKNAAKSPISSVVKSCEIKIAKLLARVIKLEPDKLDKFIDISPVNIILKNEWKVKDVVKLLCISNLLEIVYQIWAKLYF